MRFKKQFWRTLWFLNWGLIFLFWLKNNYQLFWSLKPALFILAFGRLAGFAAMYLILVQFFLMSRSYWLEKTYGLDKLAGLHHKNGKRILYFLILHPVLIILSSNLFAGTGFFEQVGFFLLKQETLKAIVGLALFLFVAGISIWTALQSLRYELWHLIHLMSYAAILLIFSHQFKLGSSLNKDQWLYYYWAFLYVFVGLNIVLFRILRPTFAFLKHDFFVSKVVVENYNTNSIYISGRNINQFKVLPGQFMIFRFLDAKRWWEAHPFSLSRPNGGQDVRITAKAVGNFTKEIGRLKPGTKVIIEGPYGVFTDTPEVLNKVLLIAGGIGITPLRSLAEAMAQKGKDVALLFSTKTKQDIVFEKELAEIRGLKTFYVSTDVEGYLDKEKIASLVPDFIQREVFLCGPGPMMSSVRKTLKEAGYPAEKIHFERFSL